ncbi:MAG: FtsX-like permease family protein [Ilumatobacteraceae bacterium]
MKAVIFRLRSTLRARWAATVGLTLVIAAVCGVIIAFAAGAQRTVSAPDRYVAAVGGGFDGIVTQEEGGPLRISEVLALPDVESAESYTFIFGGLTHPEAPTESFDTLVFAGTAGGLGERLVDGRLPNPATGNEFVGSTKFAATSGLAFGDKVQLVTYTQEQGDANEFGTAAPAGPTETATYVGVISGPASLEDGQPTVMFSTKLLETPGIGVSQSQISVRLRDGVGLDEFRTRLDTLPDSASLSLDRSELISPEIRRGINTQGRGLWLLALVASLAAVAVLGQVLTRHVRLPPSEMRPLSAIGFTDRQVLVEAMIRAALPATVGTLLGAGLAVSVSGRFPTGFVRTVEPHPGVLVQWGVLLAASAILILALLLWTLSALALARWARRTVRPSPTLDAIATRVGSPTAAIGVRFAFMRAQGERGAAKASLVGLTLTIAGLVGAITFGVSLDRLVREPFRYGANFDASLGDNGGDAMPPELEANLERDPSVTSLILYSGSQVRVGAASVPLLGFQALRGDGTPLVLNGRLPASDDEIAFGRLSAHDIGTHVGDDVTMVGPTGSQKFHVVGLVVVPGLGRNDGIGQGAVVTAGGLAQVDDATVPKAAAVRFLSGSGFPPYLAAILGPEPPNLFVPSAIGNVARVRPIPFALAAVLGALVLLTLTHVMMTSIRARRHDLAILRSLGAPRAWITRVVHWQATAFTLVPVVIGVPLGFIIGRIVFSSFADSMGALDDAALPFILVFAVVVGVLALANVVAAMPARRARRLRPAAILQAD